MKSEKTYVVNILVEDEADASMGMSIDAIKIFD
jgi:hypothetical protein